MMKKIIVLIFSMVLLLIIGTGCGKSEMKIDKESLESLKEDKLFNLFTDKYKECIPITCKKGDVTNDGLEDLIIIYKSGENIRMRVLIDGKEVIFTEEVPAPIENQTIEFKDIDNKNEVEFIVKGSKRSNIGYAIYRIENNEIKDLFGEGMNECC